MGSRLLRQVLRINYKELREPNHDEYIFCDACGDFVLEYCCVHGSLLVIPDEELPNKPVRPSDPPLAVLTIPKNFLHLADSTIPGAGMGVFASVPIPRGVRFGPYGGQRKLKSNSSYSWQIYGPDNRQSHVVDAADPNLSNWMRFVNCSRNWEEQNLVAFQYCGQIYYRTIKEITQAKELLVFYGAEFASELKINLGQYNSPEAYSLLGGKQLHTKPSSQENTCNPQIHKSHRTIEARISYDDFDDDSNVDNHVSSNKTKQRKQNVRRKPKIDPRAVSPSDHSHLLNRLCVHKGHSFYECTICFSGFTKLGEKCRKCKKRSKQNEKTFICNTCSKSFKRKSTLILHIRTHTGEKPYECETCQKKFTQSYKLKRHILIHSGVKPFSCGTCGRKFTEHSKLKIHIRTHTGEKPYKCDICDKCFAHRTSLNDHLRTHTQEKPFGCEKCQKTFRYRNNLKDHIRLHNSAVQYKCAKCHKGFTNKANWKIHVLTHRGIKQHKCKICQKSFSHQKSLVRHTRIHTGEKPYKCEICSRMFSHKNSLNRHILTHTGKKPYECCTCGTKFAHYNSYKSHLRAHSVELQFKCNFCHKRFVYKNSLNRHVRSHSKKLSVEM